MKLKTLLIVVALLAALSGATWFLNRPTPAPSSADPRVGQPVLPASVARQAARVRLSDKGKSVLITRTADSGWQVADYHDLPADLSKLSALVRSLVDAKIERHVTSSPERIGRLEFADTTITVLDASERPLLVLTLGKHAETGGRFVRFDQESKAYLARLDTWLDVEPRNWADTMLVRFTADDIARLAIEFPGDTSVTLSRPDTKTPFASDATPPGRQVKADTASSLLNTLSSLRFTDTTSPGDPDALGARRAARTLTLTTFAGKTIAFALGRRAGHAVLKEHALDPKPADFIRAQPKPDPSALVGELTRMVPASPPYVFIAHSDASATVNALMGKRAFQIGEHVLSSLPAGPDVLFEPAPAPQP
jgi:hypothetical protein